jgi:hypothetical protein
MPRSPQGRRTRFQSAPRGNLFGRGNIRRPIPVNDDDDEDDQSGSPTYDRYGYIRQREDRDEGSLNDDEMNENEDEYDQEEEENGEESEDGQEEEEEVILMQ